MTALEQSKVFRIEQEVFINAPRERVFKALTENIGDWWEFRIGPKDVPSTLTLNPVPGGQFIEKWRESDG
ncbi:SRPBCC family protein, partial [Pseudomonas sp. FW305-BF6]|uniref:SRPBCC family protein n=1 Tax=Pseudomonas sp. FW305-BF6 TaxID=2070673 RepID=UPI001C442042